MYETYWGLKVKPFQNTPDPRFLYYTSQHKDALLKLDYAIKEGLGAAMLTGLWGCGKTSLIYALLEQLNPENYKVIFITQPQLDRIELLMSIASGIGVKRLPHKRTEVLLNVIIDDLRQRLLNNVREGKETVVIIDEAHLLEGAETFEEIRLLLNLQLKDKFLLTMLLSGQPELHHKIEDFKQLEQRIALKCRLTSLSHEQTREYIQHRLKIAGQEKSLFTEPARELIYKSSGGIPRRINRLCDLSLLAGFIHKLAHIDERVIQDQTRSLSGVEEVPGVREEITPLFQRPISVPSDTPTDVGGRTCREEESQKEHEPIKEAAPIAERQPFQDKLRPTPSGAEEIREKEEITPPAREPILVKEEAPKEESEPIKEPIPITKEVKEKVEEKVAQPSSQIDDAGSKELYQTLLHQVKTHFRQVRLRQPLDIQPSIPIINGIIDKISSGDNTLIALAGQTLTDNYLIAHSVNVCILSIKVGLAQGLSKSQLLQLGLSGLLHDIGMAKTKEVKKTSSRKEVKAEQVRSRPAESSLWQNFLGIFSLPTKYLIGFILLIALIFLGWGIVTIFSLSLYTIIIGLLGIIVWVILIKIYWFGK